MTGLHDAAQFVARAATCRLASAFAARTQALTLLAPHLCDTLAAQLAHKRDGSLQCTDCTGQRFALFVAFILGMLAEKKVRRVSDARTISP